MPAFLKLKKRKEFVRAAKLGIAIPTHTIVLQAVLRSDENIKCARIGYTTTKKIGKAVVRNRSRRRLRAATALFFEKLALKNADYVLIARYNTANADFQEICRDLQYGIKKLNRQLNREKNHVQPYNQAPVSATN